MKKLLFIVFAALLTACPAAEDSGSVAQEAQLHAPAAAGASGSAESAATPFSGNAQQGTEVELEGAGWGCVGPFNDGECDKHCRNDLHRAGGYCNWNGVCTCVK